MIWIMSCADNLAHIIIRGISLLHPPIPRRQTPIADCLQSQDRTQVTATRHRFHHDLPFLEAKQDGMILQLPCHCQSFSTPISTRGSTSRLLRSSDGCSWRPGCPERQLLG